MSDRKSETEDQFRQRILALIAYLRSLGIEPQVVSTVRINGRVAPPKS